jgi:hypothetical protein
MCVEPKIRHLHFIESFSDPYPVAVILWHILITSIPCFITYPFPDTADLVLAMFDFLFLFVKKTGLLVPGDPGRLGTLIYVVTVET